MGIWIGTGLIFTAALLIGLQMLHIKAERIHKELYKIHVSFATVMYVIGVFLCVVTIDLEGIWLAAYAIIMIGFATFVCVTQKKSYDNALKLQESRDRLNELMRGD